MTTDKIDEIIQVYDQDEDRFTCRVCKVAVNPEDCKGCPIYGQSFSDD